MSLDVRTIMLVFSALTLMSSGLLALVGKYATGVKGISHWAFANLLVASGFAFSYFYSAPLPDQPGWPVIAASMLIACGLSWQYFGIRLFKGKQNCLWIAVLATGAVLLSGLWSSGEQNNVIGRAIANSVILALLFAACARELLIPAEMPLKIAYWLTGGSFATLALLLSARALVLWHTPGGTYGLFQNIPINPVTFLSICLLQIATLFGYVLMIDYRMVGELGKLASLDPLTGALNRRRLAEEASRLQALSTRTGEPMAVMMLDVDHFKKVNDRHGHQVGDEILKHAVRTLGQSIREYDYLGRYGGEEFCILLPATTQEDASLLGERLRQIYADTPYLLAGTPVPSTISIGIADSVHAGNDFRMLVQAADQALYEAKQAGRNRVKLHAPAAPLPA